MHLLLCLDLNVETERDIRRIFSIPLLWLSDTIYKCVCLFWKCIFLAILFWAKNLMQYSKILFYFIMLRVPLDLNVLARRDSFPFLRSTNESSEKIWKSHMQCHSSIVCFKIIKKYFCETCLGMGPDPSWIRLAHTKFCLISSWGLTWCHEASHFIKHHYTTYNLWTEKSFLDVHGIIGERQLAWHHLEQKM